MKEEGLKFDNGKTRYELVPPEALEEITKVLTFGATKYADRNWEKGIKYSRVFGACMRHLWAWWRGEDKDPETGLSHLAHAGCCIFFLLTFEQRKMDDFNDSPRGNRLRAVLIAKQILDDPSHNKRERRR